jgi:hypothetical protein
LKGYPPAKIYIGFKDYTEEHREKFQNRNDYRAHGFIKTVLKVPLFLVWVFGRTSTQREIPGNIEYRGEVSFAIVADEPVSGS